MATVGVKGLIILTFLDCVRFSTNLAERYTTHLTPTCTVWIGVTRLHFSTLDTFKCCYHCCYVACRHWVHTNDGYAESLLPINNFDMFYNSRIVELR